METLYHQTNKMVHEIQANLGRIEKSEPGTVQQVEQEVQAMIDRVTSNCERLEILVNKEVPTRRQNAKLRVDQLKYDNRHLQTAMRNVLYRRHQREEEDRDREALLTRTFTTNDADTSIFIDEALKQNTSLRSSHKGVDQLLDSGQNMMKSLQDQKSTLKGAHRRMMDVFNTLGMSNTVMRLIEKRSHQDKYILFAGMVITCIVIFLVVRYFT